MHKTLRIATTAALLVVPGVFAQKGEIGVVAGGGFYTKGSVTSPAGTGDVGFKSGAAVGAIFGHNQYRYLGGELRYEWLPGDQKVSSSGTEATFSSESHAIHYDFLVHFRPVESNIRPFVAAGAGVKVYRGTGKETATQPLSRLALLTHTLETKGLGVWGAGIKAKIAPAVLLRVEFRDFITPFPRQIIAPSIGAKISGILHHFVPMAGLTFTF
ncbi:MAG: hypothetical protein ACRD96_10755 [Bryobacteraceae bacterium]